ncbi:hypothetical protein [Halobacterium sp. KA-6]|uniref:hypothetical protein n=1 Tax=Halobacterium sp. KA-6 TaxID=2896368 RepID=UPI001E57DE5F|nr:hypothetical protein [Halobacterium sp. KA-6]MCD2204384.1 hypothetical protein [Halobacterium sp. KA-6]
MSGESEAFRDQLNSSLESAIAGDHDLDDIQQALEDARQRVEEIRAIRSDA